jgi:hypothetical protein
MSGILANSASQTMLAGATSADNAVSGYIALEEVALSVTPTGSSYSWAIAKPSSSTARARLSSTTDASPTFTPDVAGYYTLTCVVDSVTTYVLRVAVSAIGEVATIDAIRLVPILNAQVPTPATGRTIFSSSDLNDLAQKLPDGNTYAIAGGGGGSGSGYYATIAALKAITSTMLASLDDGVSLAYVAPLRAWFVWDATSAVADDTTDFLSVAVTANGVAAGRWRRLDWAHPSWREQTAWFVSTAGSNDNDGATALTPVKTDEEIVRRWGVGARPTLEVAVTITYAQSPATITNFTYELASTGSLTFIGTPTVSKAGTVLTAVQAQVRTAGAEAAWAITAVGLDATDVGKLVFITSGANTGAYAAVLKDETGGKVRVSPFGTFNSTTGAFAQVTPLVGDTVEIRDMAATTLSIGKIEGHTANNTPATVPASRTQFDSIKVAGTSGGQATLFGGGSGFYYVRAVAHDVCFSGFGGQYNTVHFFRGGSIGGASGVISRSTLSLSQVGCLGTVQARAGGTVTVGSDTYFQNCACFANQGGNVSSSGAAFFDRSSSDLACVVAPEGSWQQSGAVPDWGTNNTGHGVTVQSTGSYVYATKPTVNSGLGAGREAKVGGTDRLYSQVSYVEAANNAALVAFDVVADGSAVAYQTYANVAALKAITAARLASLTDGQRVYVTTLKAWFAWDALATDADDATDFLVLTVTSNGVAAGRFRRLNWAHPAWALQATWFVSTAGSNDNDGATALTPVRSDLEIARRWGSEVVFSSPVTVTYAQSPTTTTNLDVAYVDGGSLTLLGTPTVTNAGTVLTAVQTQVRTAGAELGWAITGSGLGASDVGKIAVITAGTAGNVGAYAAVLKDEGGGKVRVSPFGKATTAGTFTQVTPIVGDTIEIRDMSATTLKVGFINVRGRSQLNAVASPVQNVMVFDSLLLDGSVGGGLNGGILHSEAAAFVYLRCLYQDLIFASGPVTFSKLHSLMGGLFTAGSGGCDLRTAGTIRQVAVLGTFISVSAHGGIPTFTSDCYFQNAQLNVNAGCAVATAGVAFFDKSASDSALTTGVASNGGGAFVRHSGAVADWGTANAGHGLVVRNSSSYIYATKPTINSGLGAGREVLLGGTDKLYSAVPFIDPGSNSVVIPGDNTDSSAVFAQAYANVAALKAITAARLAGLVDGQRVYVTTLKAWFAWDALSAVADDTTDFLSVSVTANGVAAGRFRRLDWAHPSWREQTAWFVSTAGSNENDGLTVGTPVRTDAEIQRRWGAYPRVNVDATITYAQSPSGLTNLLATVGPTGRIRFVGTPTVTKTGTVLTAVQTQVRTAGAELGWAITAVGLAAADVGKFAVITASGTPANIGAYAFILKDETGGKVRTSPFGTYATGVTTFTAVTPLVGDTIEIRDMTTVLSVGAIELHSADNAGLPNQGCIFDSITLHGNASTFSGAVVANRVTAHYVKTVVNSLSLAGLGTSVTFHSFIGSGVASGNGVVVRTGAIGQFRQTGFLGNLSSNAGSTVSLFADCYFQNTNFTVTRGSAGLSQGVAFFDRASSDSALVVGALGSHQQTGAVPDWGTANAGHGIRVQSVASYSYATKPTINSGLGAGREAQVGGTDKLYAATPFIEPANNAALVLTA